MFMISCLNVLVYQNALLCRIATKKQIYTILCVYLHVYMIFSISGAERYSSNCLRSTNILFPLFTPSKDIFIRTFSIVALFSYSNVSIAVYTRTTSLCNLASKIQGSRARSDAYEQTRRIFTLPSRKRLKEQPNQPLFLMLSISLKF